MGAVQDAINLAFRDYVTEGVPASGAHEPRKFDIRAVGSVIEQLLAVNGLDAIYESTAEGIAATTNGDLFLVKGSGETFADLYKNNAGSAVAQNISLPSSVALLRAFRSGTLAEREAIPTGQRVRGFQFLVTDITPWRTFEWRLTGDLGGAKRDGAALGSNQWVGLYTPAEEKNLAIDFTDVLPAANVGGMAEANAAIDGLASIEIADFRAEALSSDASPTVNLSWQIKGVQPTAQTVSWGASSIALAAGARSFTPKDWAAIKPIFVVGNSLSDSSDVANRWSQLLAADKGVTLYSTARYSSDARQVYRTGAEPLLLTIAGGVLPVGGSPASVSLINGLAPSNDASVNPASFLNTGSGDTGLTTNMSMAGTIIAGNVARHGTVSIPNGASTAYTIVQDAGGAAVTLTGPVQFIPDVSRQMASSDVIIWLGNNYFYSGVPNTYGDHTNPNMWVDLAKLVAAAQGNRVLMLPVIPSTAMALGSEVYTAMLAANARTEAFFPSAIARDTAGRTLLQRLQASGNNSADDNSDIANGWVPRSLRTDALHLNAAGDAVAFAFVKEALARQAVPTSITQGTVFTLNARGTNPRTDVALADTAVAAVEVSSQGEVIEQIQDDVDDLRTVVIAGGSPYFATREAGAAGVATGAYFTTDETGTLNRYLRTDSTPFYQSVGPALTKASVGLSDVDNYSAADMPVSTATADALTGKVAVSTLSGEGGAAAVGFMASGAGASFRTAADKLKDRVDAKDFGALDDNATDNHAAITAALAAHGRVHLSGSVTSVYRVSQPIDMTGNMMLTSDSGVTIYGTGAEGALLLHGEEIYVDVGEVIAPAAQYCVRYYNLVWSVVKIRRAGLSSKAVIFMDGAAQSVNAGVNEWHVGDIQAGSCEYGIWLKNSGTYTYEGDVWNIRCILSATICALKIGETPASHTLRWNRFRLAVDAQGITPLLVDFQQDQNHVDLYNWAGIVDPPVAHVTFHADVGANRLDSAPGIQDPLIVKDNGFNTWHAQGQAGAETVGALVTNGYIADTGRDIHKVENKSAADVTTKYVGYGLMGRDTYDAGKTVAAVRAIPQDSDWVNTTLVLHSRLADALVGMAFFGINGTPEGQITAPVGALATRRDGGTGTTLYVKQSGAGNTGWVAK